MQRRKYLAAIGSMAAAGGAVMGTGAFTSVQAQRTADVDVVNDSGAYLSLQATGDRATTDGDGQLKLDFSTSKNGANGLNEDARTAFTDLFTLANQGDNPATIAVGVDRENVYADPSANGQGHLFDNPGVSGFVYKEEGGSGVGLGAGGGGHGTIQIDSGGRVDMDLNDSQLDASGLPNDGSIAAKRTLGPGESLSVDLTIITTDDPEILGANSRISVLAAEPGSDRANGGNGT